MKKVIAISTVLFGVVFLAGCGQQPAVSTPAAKQQPTQSAAQPTPPPAAQPIDETASLKTYLNTKYGFEFKYPNNIFVYDATDETNGQIPDVAGFGYTKPGQYNMGDSVPADKMGSARILAWTNISQDLKSWVQTKEPNIINWTNTEIGNIAALVNYTKDGTSSERTPMTTKTYYLKNGNTIVEIMGFSVTNQYSDSWIVDFDKIVATFKFTK